MVRRVTIHPHWQWQTSSTTRGTAGLMYAVVLRQAVAASLVLTRGIAPRSCSEDCGMRLRTRARAGGQGLRPSAADAHKRRRAGPHGRMVNVGGHGDVQSHMHICGGGEGSHQRSMQAPRKLAETQANLPLWSGKNARPNPRSPSVLTRQIAKLVPSCVCARGYVVKHTRPRPMCLWPAWGAQPAARHPINNGTRTASTTLAG